MARALDLASPAPATARWPALLRAGFRVSWPTVLLIAAINTGVAALLWIEDPRPFWHPLLSAQCFGFAIAYCVNVASPWERSWPVARLIAAVACGTLIGMLLVVLLKGYTPSYMAEQGKLFGLTLATAFTNGVFVSLFFLIKFREARAERALLKAESERHLLAKQAAESELKLMQAQVEPHFLFNTLASVQYLVETDAPRANRLLAHLLDYLRAALPQLRTADTQLGKEVQMAEAYLRILEMRMGARLAFEVNVPAEVRAEGFPPGLLITLVENAIEHGIEPQAAGGKVTIDGRREGERLIVSVADTGRGVAHDSAPANGRGVGLANVRERLAALYGERGRFTLDTMAPHGTRATIDIPVESAA